MSDQEEPGHLGWVQFQIRMTDLLAPSRMVGTLGVCSDGKDNPPFPTDLVHLE